MYFVKTTHYGQLHLNKRQKLILNQQTSSTTVRSVYK